MHWRHFLWPTPNRYHGTGDKMRAHTYNKKWATARITKYVRFLLCLANTVYLSESLEQSLIYLNCFHRQNERITLDSFHRKRKNKKIKQNVSDNLGLFATKIVNSLIAFPSLWIAVGFPTNYLDTWKQVDIWKNAN